jgi:uncharacterized protein (TIGR03083 family)
VRVADLARDERADLADLLESLSPQQRDAPSLCEHWRVRDVVAHLVSYDGLGAADLARRSARGRFVLDRVNEVGVDEHREREPHELVALLRAHAVPSGLPAGFGGRIALVDTLIHHQDVRRPLGLPRTVPPERLRAALPIALLAPPIRAPWHVRGVRVVATDVDWSGGAGPEARGPGEACSW